MLMSPALQVLRVKLTAVAIGGLLLTASHASAKNHDCQTFKLRVGGVTLHDRAPGPSPRDAN